MQTFLPYADFAQSARALDRQRLGKQRVEVKQILNVLKKGSGGWANHPAVKMWRGYEMALCNYGIAVCGEWTVRGYKDTLTEFFLAQFTPSRTSFASCPSTTPHSSPTSAMTCRTSGPSSSSHRERSA